MRVFRSLGFGLVLATLAGGCVISSEPLLGDGDRVVPFASGTRFAIYERDDAGKRWKRSRKTVALVADEDKVVREQKDTGLLGETEHYTFHPLGGGRYLVQAHFGAKRYAYGVLAIRKREGIITALQCQQIDRAALESAGGAVVADDCVLDGIPDAVAYLKRLAERPAGGEIKYVPVRQK